MSTHTYMPKILWYSNYYWIVIAEKRKEQQKNKNGLKCSP
jgi:hypothetical protein